MNTPAGKYCRYYHQDFHRGRNVQECRLVAENPNSMRWRPGDCVKCTVPESLNANASPNLKLQLTIKPKLLGLGRMIVIEAHCIKHNIPIEDPFTGCSQCNSENSSLDIFRRALEQSDDD